MELVVRDPLVAGLTTAEVDARRRVDGPNELPAPPRPSAVRMVVGELTHFFALLLWVAALLAAVAGMPQLALAIVVVVVVNGIFAFAQQHRAEQAAERLRDLLPRRATVRRDGKLAISDLTGGTFTITNGGIFGSLLSTPILNTPQVGILGMHAIQQRPVVRDGEIPEHRAGPAVEAVGRAP